MRVQHLQIQHRLPVSSEKAIKAASAQAQGISAMPSAASSATNALLMSLDSAAREHYANQNSDNAIAEFQEQFSSVAGDKDAFHKLMAQSFGDNYDYNSAETIRQQALSGDFSWMPSIEVVDASALADTSSTQGAGVGLAAYNSETNTIYMSNELLQGPSDTAVALLTEEVGHALDNQLNDADSVGDEGELFAQLVAGNELSQAQIDTIKADNDHGTIIVDGNELSVEYGFFSSFVDAVTSVAGAVVDAVVDVVDVVVDVVEATVDVVSDTINTAGEFVGDAVNAAGDLLSDGFDIVNENIVSPVLNFIPGGSFINDHFVQPTFGLIDSGIAFTTNLFDSGVDFVTHSIDGLVNVTGNLLVGNLSGAWDATVNTGKNLFGDVAGGIVESVAIAANGLAGWVNDTLGLAESRGLTAGEQAYLQTIYGDSIDYDEITIQQGGGLEELIGMDPHAITNDIYLPDENYNADGTLTPDGLELLSHEIGHVWQYQNDGANSISQAVGSYIDDRDAAYDYSATIDAGTEWEDLTPDQQAEFAMIIGMALAIEPAGLTIDSIERAIDRENGTEARPSLTLDQYDRIVSFHEKLKSGDV